MRCERVEDKNKQLTLMVCRSGRKQEVRCRYCNAFASRLCDYPMRIDGRLTTCDIPMCDRCTTKPEPGQRRIPTDEDYCRMHATQEAGR